MKEPARKILIIQTAFIGDVILATALVEKIKAHEPASEIHFLCRKGNEGVLANHPHISQVWVWDKRRHKYLNWWRLLQQIRQAKFDLIINLQRFAATGLLTVLSGAGQTVGYKQNPLSWLYTHRVPHRIEAGIHEVQRNAMLYRPDDTYLHLPKIYPSADDVAVINIYTSAPYITIAPASVWFTKQWPAAKWVEFIKMVPPQMHIYLLGAASDAALCEHIIREAARGNVYNLAGRLGLLQSAAMMRKALMNYVNDSAPMHLCSAVDAPVCAVFCSTVPDFGFGPLSTKSYLIQVESELSCRPCGLHGKRACPEQHFACALQIQASTLLQPLHMAMDDAGITLTR